MRPTGRRRAEAPEGRRVEAPEGRRETGRSGACEAGRRREPPHGTDLGPTSRAPSMGESVRTTSMGESGYRPDAPAVKESAAHACHTAPPQVRRPTPRPTAQPGLVSPNPNPNPNPNPDANANANANPNRLSRCSQGGSARSRPRLRHRRQLCRPPRRPPRLTRRLRWSSCPWPPGKRARSIRPRMPPSPPAPPASAAAPPRQRGPRTRSRPWRLPRAVRRQVAAGAAAATCAGSSQRKTAKKQAGPPTLASGHAQRTRSAARPPAALGQGATLALVGVAAEAARPPPSTCDPSWRSVEKICGAVVWSTGVSGSLAARARLSRHSRAAPGGNTV